MGTTKCSNNATSSALDICVIVLHNVVRPQRCAATNSIPFSDVSYFQTTFRNLQSPKQPNKQTSKSHTNRQYIVLLLARPGREGCKQLKANTQSTRSSTDRTLSVLHRANRDVPRRCEPISRSRRPKHPSCPNRVVVVLCGVVW